MVGNPGILAVLIFQLQWKWNRNTTAVWKGRRSEGFPQGGRVAGKGPMLCVCVYARARVRVRACVHS